MINFKQGEYVYIPSEVTLYRFAAKTSDIEKTYITKTPQHLMFIKKVQANQVWLKVFYNGELWCVNEKHTYPLREAQ
jgi:uncharacterized protein YbaR (Trm112 family)